MRTVGECQLTRLRKERPCLGVTSTTQYGAKLSHEKRDLLTELIRSHPTTPKRTLWVLSPEPCGLPCTGVASTTAHPDLAGHPPATTREGRLLANQSFPQDLHNPCGSAQGHPQVQLRISASVVTHFHYRKGFRRRADSRISGCLLRRACRPGDGRLVRLGRVLRRWPFLGLR
jgi:hypothetical protein